MACGMNNGKCHRAVASNPGSHRHTQSQITPAPPPRRIASAGSCSRPMMFFRALWDLVCSDPAWVSARLAVGAFVGRGGASSAEVEHGSVAGATQRCQPRSDGSGAALTCDVARGGGQVLQAAVLAGGLNLRDGPRQARPVRGGLVTPRR
jgi:hypothetical protein